MGLTTDLVYGRNDQWQRQSQATNEETKIAGFCCWGGQGGRFEASAVDEFHDGRDGDADAREDVADKMLD